MSLKFKIRQVIFRNHYWIEKLNSKAELEIFLSRFRKNYVSCDLIRIGGYGDGGYLVPNILDDISYCFSPGVSVVANFEKELSEKFNIKSFMADASVKKAPISGDNFEFIPKFLGAYTKGNYITLNDWMKQYNLDKKKGIILQMDIEGAEYETLIFEDSKLLASYSVMIIEFHNLQKLFERDFLKTAFSIFEKIYQNFSICHVHPNNCCGIASLDGIDIPRVIEVTFIRNDLLNKCSIRQPITLPHQLDEKNFKQNDDIMMPKIWWKYDNNLND